MGNEEKRQFAHILLLLFAFLLKYLDRFSAALLVLGLLIIMVLVVPRTKARLHFYRRQEQAFSQGAIIYFVTLFFLVLIFPLHIVAASWAILALGDGSATLIGRHFKATELPWNSNKTYVGSMAFVIFGAIGAAVLLWWTLPDVAFAAMLGYGLRAAIVAAVVESLPIRINDNATVALASALTLSFLL